MYKCYKIIVTGLKDYDENVPHKITIEIYHELIINKNDTEIMRFLHHAKSALQRAQDSVTTQNFDTILTHC